MVARFRFIPDARLDDLMVSYASQGGGVGPHQDGYDVFLLQALGKRRWRIERRPDPACVPGLPIRQLGALFTRRRVGARAGDLLYLPPGVAMTVWRSGLHDLLDWISDALVDRFGRDLERAAVGAQPAATGPISRSWIDAFGPPGPAARADDEEACRQLLVWRPSRGDVATALLRQLSEPSPASPLSDLRAPWRRPASRPRSGCRVCRRTGEPACCIRAKRSPSRNPGASVGPHAARVDAIVRRPPPAGCAARPRPARGNPGTALRVVSAGWVHPPSAGYA